MPVRFQQDHQESGEMVSLTDDSKAATTDAQKKCATMLGIGLHLYNGDNSRCGTNSSEITQFKI